MLISFLSIIVRMEFLFHILLFLFMVIIIYILSIHGQEYPLLFTFYRQSCLLSLLVAIATVLKLTLTVILICIFLTTRNVKNIALSSCMPALRKCLFRCIANIWNEMCYFFFSVFGVPHILEVNCFPYV